MRFVLFLMLVGLGCGLAAPWFLPNCNTGEALWANCALILGVGILGAPVWTGL